MATFPKCIRLQSLRNLYIQYNSSHTFNVPTLTSFLGITVFSGLESRQLYVGNLLQIFHTKRIERDHTRRDHDCNIQIVALAYLYFWVYPPSESIDHFRLSVCIFILTSLFFHSVSLYVYFLAMNCRKLAHLTSWLHFMITRDDAVIQKFVISNSQHTYRKRLRGKTRTNYFYYYGYKFRELTLQLPSFRHTLILDLDETLVYSCRYSDLSLMVPSLESIGITIVGVE